MKIFWQKRNIKVSLGLFVLFFLGSCASYHPEYGKEAEPFPKADTMKKKELSHRFFLVGDAGYANEPHSQQMLSIIRERLKGEGENTSIFYLGDNIYPYGMPDKDSKKRKDAEGSLDSQLALAKVFKGKTYFIPGNHDWYNGLKGVKEQEKYIVERLKDKDAFLPGKGCGIDDVEINDNVALITIDSQWFIEDWDKYPTINDDCDIKTRDAMFNELEGLLNDYQNKIVVLAIHHPLMSNGTHGGHFSLRKHLYPLKYKIPLPVIGSLINLTRKASGYSTQDLQSRVYIELINRVKTLVQEQGNVIVVSGHDHNLQYVEKDNIHQIISGSGSKVEAAKAVYPHDFTYGGTGYATLDIYKDGTAKVIYYATKSGKDEKLFEKNMLIKPEVIVKDYPDKFPPVTTTSVYTPEMTKKSGFHRFLFGDHYRYYYSLPIQAKTAMLDTLYGGLKPERAGGGHQSNSLRLLDKKGREYVMRAVKKSALRFLQAAAFKNRYVGEEFKGTFAEDFFMDFYTSAHPYAPFALDDLAESAGISHTNPELYYIPKQDALGEFNEEFGDELYLVEERPVDKHKDLKSFGKPDAIDGTEKLMENLRKDPKYTVDERAYIRARLFDILIGDWDRHTDQWRWGSYEGKDSIVYRPIPRDRDQAFPKYDGKLLSLLLNIPGLRHMQSFKEDIRNIKWLNREVYPLDVALIKKSGKNVWLEEARSLQESLTDEAIDNAFKDLPKEVQDETLDVIKMHLKSRRAKLEKYAMDYRDVLLKTVILTGTDKIERFEITRMKDGDTEVKIYSLKDKDEKLLHSVVYNSEKTKEIWVYGLDDDDIFEVKGKPEKPITLRLLGGQNHDNYKVENGRRIRIYDFKSKENTYTTDRRTKLILTDDYETNSYDFEKPDYNIVAGYPNAGYNPDDGVKLGAQINFTINNFNRRPYSHKHSVRANYYFATNGFELGYRGNFMNVSSRWNFALDMWYTSPNFSINYFGMGNETPNYDSHLENDYNRVKLQVFRVAPSFFTQSRNGSVVELQGAFETIEVDGTNDRFVNEPGVLNPYLFEHRQYGSVNARYSFANYNNVSLPTLGMGFNFAAGWTTSLDNAERNFPHTEGSIHVVHYITNNENLVFATLLKGRVLFNNDFEFYQGAALGGDTSLRSYRRERFTGKSSFFQSTDLRLTLGRWMSTFLPMKYGILGGYDYGRVWVNDDRSEKWHQSVGGGLWLNGVESVTARLQYFYGSDGGRVSFGLQFGI